MTLMASFRPECIQVGSTARDRDAVLREIARLARRSTVLEPWSEEGIFQALQAREKIGSTGFGNGIAIPHCSLERLAEFVVGVLIAPRGVEFGAPDGASKAFFFIVGPREQRDRHIQLLSGISKILKKPRIIDRFLEARDPRMVKSIIAEFFNLIQIGVGEGPQGKCLFHVFVQREEVFADILQTFSAAVQGSVAVVEANRAGHYLHTIPLFSAYMKEGNHGFSRIITAVVDRDLCNEVIRRIHMIAEDSEQEPGVLIAVQELFYSSGSLEF